MPEQPPLGPDPDPASDPAFDSLRDADPMARAGADHSDDAAIREHVRSRLAEQAAPQRRRPWLTVAAAAAAAIVIGGGGYLVGAAVTDRPVQTAGDLQSSVSAPITDAPVEALEGPAVGGAAPESDAAAAPQLNRDQTAGGQESLASPSADKMSALWSGRTEFGQQGLSTEAPADGEVSAINTVVPDPSVLVAVGALVGVDGQVQDTSSGEWKSWSVGPQDGTGPNVFLDGYGNLSANNPAAWEKFNSCASVGVADPAVDPAVEVAPVPDIMPVEPCPPSEPLPALDRTAAEETIRSILTAVGLDASAYTITWADDFGDGQSSATVTPNWAPASTSGGAEVQRLSLWVPGSWNFSWIGDTFSNANGVIAQLDAAGSYALISPAQAVERMSDPRFGQPAMVGQPDTGEIVQPTGPGSFTGGPIPWPVAQVTITSADLQQSTLTLSNGVTLLAPTYRLASADGYVWEVSALVDSAFDFAS